MTVLQTLTLAEVKAKAREYYDAGKLTAQHPISWERRCVNIGADGHRCAVAAAFNDALIDECPRGTFRGIVSEGNAEADDVDAIEAIQMAHDEWACYAYRNLDCAHTKQLEEDFLALINAA